jgi:hypothetical protein
VGNFHSAFTEATVRERLTQIFEMYGLPGGMITDNGNPWGQQNGPTRRTRLSVWLIRLGSSPCGAAPVIRKPWARSSGCTAP